MATKKNNKVCVTCGKIYTYCPTCAEYAGKPRSMYYFHDENCKAIYNTAMKYTYGVIDEETALVELDECDLSARANFSENVKAVVDAIISED